MFFMRLKLLNKKRKKFSLRLNHLPSLVMLSVAVIVAGYTIKFAEKRIDETVTAMAQIQAEHQVRLLVDEAISKLIEEYDFHYSSFISIERDESGSITALVSNMAQMNSFRSRLIQQLWHDLNGNRICSISVPLGNLFQSELAWGKGPEISIEIVAVSNVSATFKSEFTDSGINQTLHRINLQITVPIALLLPGKRMELLTDVQLPIAETVIIGRIPDTCLQISELPATG